MRVVEGKGFLEMMAHLEQGAQSKAHHLGDTQRHDLGKKGLQEKLSEVASLAFTTDIWTSEATEAYITVTGHFVTPSWDLCSCVLSTATFPDRHTSPAIALKLQEIVADFNVNSAKDKAIVHDQAGAIS